MFVQAELNLSQDSPFDFNVLKDFRTARAKCIKWFPFKRELEIEPWSLAAVLMLSDPNGGRPNPFIKETFAHDQGDQGLEGEKKAGKRCRNVQEPNEMPPLNGNWLPRESRKEGVKDS